MKRKHLHLVGSDPTEIFDDMDKLQADRRKPGKHLRPRTIETFARIPHARGRELATRYKIGNYGWALLIELDRQLLRGRGLNPMHFRIQRLTEQGISRQAIHQALLRLERAGVVRVERFGRGRPRRVFHLWYPRRN